MPIIIINAIVVINFKFAPNPKPIDIVKNKYASSSGSFIAALKRTIDKAPTKPKESAKDDFTTEIINIVVNANNIKFPENIFLLDKLLPHFR